MKYSELPLGYRVLFDSISEYLFPEETVSDLLMLRKCDITDIVFSGEDTQYTAVVDNENPLQFSYEDFLSVFDENYRKDMRYSGFTERIESDDKFSRKLKMTYKKDILKAPVRIMNFKVNVPDGKEFIHISVYSREAFFKQEAEKFLELYNE